MILIVRCNHGAENKNIGATGADPLMEAIQSTKNTSVQSVAHDEDVLREELSLFLKLWPKLSTWAPTTMLSDTDEKLARFAAEYGHPTIVSFLHERRFSEKTVE